MVQLNELTKLSGIDIFLPHSGLWFSQPTMKEMALIGEDTFFSVLAFFKASLDKEKFIDAQLQEVEEEKRPMKKVELGYTFDTEYKVFCAIIDGHHMNQFFLNSFLTLIFADIRKVDWFQETQKRHGLKISVVDRVSKEPREIIFNNELFLELAGILGDLFSTDSESKEDFNPVGTAAQAIAEKMRIAREKRAMNSGQQQGKKDNVIATIISVFSTLSGHTINEILDMTFYQLLTQYNRAYKLEAYRAQIALGAMGGIDPDTLPDWDADL